MKKLLLNKLMWLFLCVGLCTTHVGWTQDRQITGKVTGSADNTPLPGVSVIVKGTTRGTTTAADGTYKISVNEGATLIYTSLGFEKRDIKVGNQSVIDIKLTDATSALDEVVVTALGIKQEKRALGYSVQEVKGDEITQTGRDNVLTSLGGRVAGLTMTPSTGLPGSSVQIQLRGASSIGGNNSPLFVIDGLPVSNRTFNQEGLVSTGANRSNDYASRMGDLNPNDVESVTVLKGLEAAALYGSEGSSGVIMITTKKGTKGATRVNYSNSFDVSNVYRFVETQKVYGRGSYGVLDPTSLFYRGPKYSETANNQIYDNAANFYQTGSNQQHNLSIDGGDKVSYRFSASYTDQKGVIPTTGKTQLQTRLTGSAQIAKGITITNSLSLVSQDITKGYRGGNGFYLSALAWPANDDMRVYLNPDGTRRRLITADNSELDNPYFSLYKNQNTEKTIRVNENISLSADITPWLNFTGRFGVDSFNSFLNLLINPESGSGSSAGATNGIAAKGYIDNAIDAGRIFNGNFLLSAKKKIGDFDGSFLVGTSFEDNKTETNAIYGEKLYLPDFNSINNTDVTTQRAKTTIIQKRLQSVFGSFDLNYKDLLYLKVTGRNDWSSALYGAPRYDYFYPSVSASFVFTELPVFKEIGFLSFGKLRASYAETGKDPATPYKIKSSLTPQTSTDGGFAYGFYGGNPDLKPERGVGIEVGTDLRFFKGRFGIDAAYYTNERSNQIVTQRLSYGTGFIFGLVNGGTFSNSGVEIQLTGSPVKTKDFSWDVNLNFSKLKTAVKDLPAQVAEYYNSDTWLYNNARASAFVSDLTPYFGTIDNLSYYQQWAGSATSIGGYSYLRNKAGDILINPSTGLPIKNTNFLPIGDRNPDFTIGLRNSFTYKGFTLSFLLDIRKGGDVFNGNAMWLYERGLSPKTLDRNSPVVFKGVLRDGYENSATPTTNTVQVTPSTSVNQGFYSALAESDFVEHSVNWLRMRDANLSYSIPKKVLSNVKFIKNASVFVRGTELFLITNYTGADPSVNGTTATSLGVGASGIDFGTVSLPRTFSTGISVTF
ncbi:MAG: SusC/RagA family TonB-linked outer membrane protein [Bacteroidota bacterium]|jgi:TonB-linked SusC/RagA family outer membrane protein